VAFEGREPRPVSPATGGTERGRPEAEERGSDAPAVPHPDASALNGGPVETVEDAAPGAQATPAEAALERGASPQSAVFELIADAVFLPPATTPSEPRKTRHSASKRARPKTSKARRSSGTPKMGPRARSSRPAARSAPAAPDDIGEDSVGLAPVQSRTGVCRSYFINHECWRVPNAYCNTALQVCVIRNCPVYHLHKDALERRFAKKFKHLW
jgi:hypothetical protein